MKVKVACIQTSAGPDIQANLHDVGQKVRAAAAVGAQLVALPENVCLMTCDAAKKRAAAVSQDTHPAFAFFSALAKEAHCWLLSGSVGIGLPDGKIANRLWMFSPLGEAVATYDKIHLFDADLAKGESYRESDVFSPGDRAVMATTGVGKIGMTICYDMRFAALYRALAKAGAQIITVPAAFTVPTGQAHWHVLLRARAIETGCFIVAPAQCGTHDGGRCTYGHSLIISPWGDILAEAEDAPTTLFAELDLDRVNKTRQQLPSLQHDKPFTF